jgi:hypothetical protein
LVLRERYVFGVYERFLTVTKVNKAEVHSIDDTSTNEVVSPVGGKGFSSGF